MASAAAGCLYHYPDGTLRKLSAPVQPGRAVSSHRLPRLTEAGFLALGEPDALGRRPVRVTGDGRQAVAVWKRWRPAPAAKAREEEWRERLRPLLGGEQEARLAERAREDEQQRRADREAFYEAVDRLHAWKDREERMRAAWAAVNGVRLRFQRRQAGRVPTAQEIGEHRLHPAVVADLRADAAHPQPKPELPRSSRRPQELPPPPAAEPDAEQLDLFATADTNSGLAG